MTDTTITPEERASWRDECKNWMGRDSEIVIRMRLLSALETAQAENARLRAERRHNALTWTTEPPKVAGWYWWRTSKGQNASILRIWSRSGVFGYYFDQEFMTELSRGEWAGPIPMPLEPEES